MTVYFVDRSFYDGPGGRSCYRCNADSVLSCFQAFWGKPPDPNMGVPFLAHVLEKAAEEGVPVPQTMAELADRIPECVYSPDVVFTEHSLQVMSDDDEIEFAWYVFDDHYRTSHPASFTAFLLHEGWELPDGMGRGDFVPRIEAALLRPEGRGEGTTWFVLQAAEDGLNLTEMLAPMRIDGVRLPDLCSYLAEVIPSQNAPDEIVWPWELRLLRTQVQHGESGAAGLRVALERTNALNVKKVDLRGDWQFDNLAGDLASAQRELAVRLPQIEEFNRISPLAYPTDPSLSLIQCEEHVAQLCLSWSAPDERYGRRYGSFFKWIFFDDLWASAHPDLANGLLRYASRWDVLSEENETEE